MTARPTIPLKQQVEIYFRDHWLCRWCGRPVIFPPALSVLQQIVQQQHLPSVAYFHGQWSRKDAPLLDDLGIVLDHVNPFVNGGETNADNLVVACNKCNVRKNSGSAESHSLRNPKRTIRSKYGEPVAWDGFASVFVIFANSPGIVLGPTDKKWLAALRNHFEAEKFSPE